MVLYSGMPLRVHKPAFPLSQYVEEIYHISSSGMPPSRKRVYPSGAMELVVHLRQSAMSFYIDDQRHSISVPLLAGPYTRSFHVDPSESTAVIGIRFRPGAARVFFRVAAHELHNTDIALNQLFPAEADHLLNEVCSANGEDAQISMIERYLNRKLANAAPVHPAITYAVQHLSREGAASVQKIQSEVGLSHTRFIQLFREHVGLTPKLFCRVRRFRGLIDRIDKGLPVNWADLAVECGYFDQAHLIRDFRAFAGITPLEYSRSAADSRVAAAS